jgi:hypothetical protein
VITNQIDGWSYNAAGNLLYDQINNYTYDAETNRATSRLYGRVTSTERESAPRDSCTKENAETQHKTFYISKLLSILIVSCQGRSKREPVEDQEGVFRGRRGAGA